MPFLCIQAPLRSHWCHQSKAWLSLQLPSSAHIHIFTDKGSFLTFVYLYYKRHIKNYKIILEVKKKKKEITIQFELSYSLFNNFQFFSFFEGQVIFMKAIIRIQSYYNESMLFWFYKYRKAKDYSDYFTI